MKRNPLAIAIKLATTGVLAGALVACGGSGGGTPASTTTTGTSVGPVTGFGSVYVNGVRFHTNGSVGSDDGIEREDQLEKGMILKVSGSWDDSSGEGDAREIEYDDTLRGSVTAATWDEATKSGTLTVLGQTVVLDGQTVFRGATAVELRDSNSGEYRVRISAWPLANGNFRASFVGAGNASNGFPSDDQFNEVEVKGLVANHDGLAQTFTINGLQVDYTSAVADDDFSLDRIANGVGVEVEGSLENGVLIAREIDDEDDFFFGLTGTVEFQGAIEGDYDDSTQQFVVNGVTVQVSSGTEFKDGLVTGDLVNGRLVKVEGSFNSDDVLVAREIESEEGEAEVEALIESIDRVNETMVVGGVNVAITNSTIVEDDSDDRNDRVADLESLGVDQFVEVEGRFRNGVLEAVSIERDDFDNDFDLDGRVSAITGNTITVLGLELQANGRNIGQFSVGDPVEVDYFRNSGGSYLITEINLDLPDDGSGSGSDDSGSDDGNGSTDDNNGVDQSPG
jgi:hypothetical protein